MLFVFFFLFGSSVEGQQPRLLLSRSVSLAFVQYLLDDFLNQGGFRVKANFLTALESGYDFCLGAVGSWGRHTQALDVLEVNPWQGLQALTAQFTGHNSPCSLVVGGQQQQQDQCSTEEPAGGRGHGARLKCGWSLECPRKLVGGGIQAPETELAS